MTVRKPDLAYLVEFEQLWKDYARAEETSITFTNGASGDFMHAQVRLLLQDFHQLQAAHADETERLYERLCESGDAHDRMREALTPFLLGSGDEQWTSERVVEQLRSVLGGDTVKRLRDEAEMAQIAAEYSDDDGRDNEDIDG